MQKIKKPRDIEGKILTPEEWSTRKDYLGIARFLVGNFESRWQPERFYLHPRFCPPKGLGRGSLCQQSKARRQNMLINPPKSTNKISFPTRRAFPEVFG